MTDELQVVVVDDHPSLRRGLELILPKLGFRVTGTAGTAEEGSTMIASRRPNVAVLDIGLGEASGTNLANQVSAMSDPPSTVIYTGCTDAEVLAKAVASGALGVVQKTSPLEDLATAIRAAAKGRTFLDPRVAELLAGAGNGHARLISEREAEVLGLMASGLTADDVGERLCLSSETVKTHVRNAIRKLGARGRLHAVILALQRGDLEVAGLARPAADDGSYPESAIAAAVPRADG
jgi:DNA-binding NarL/FixJ family response regulator